MTAADMACKYAFFKVSRVDIVDTLASPAVKVRVNGGVAIVPVKTQAGEAKQQPLSFQYAEVPVNCAQAQVRKTMLHIVVKPQSVRVRRCRAKQFEQMSSLIRISYCFFLNHRPHIPY